MKRRRRYTLKGRIGSRPDTLPRKVALGIGIYVLGAVGGWTTLAVLVAVMWP
jgi:hypothetical protein